MASSLPARAGALVPLAFLAALTAAVAGCGDSSEPASSTTLTSEVVPPVASTVAATTVPGGSTIEVRFAGGNVVGGPRREMVALGRTVVIRATSDVPEELHVHTYDLRTDLVPGQPGEIRLEADIPGRHEVELEKAGKLALTLEVR